MHANAIFTLHTGTNIYLYSSTIPLTYKKRDKQTTIRQNRWMGSFQMAPTAQSHEQCTAPAGSGVGQNNSPKGQKQIDSPAHPIHQLQGAFDESIVEALGKTKNEWVVDLDAQSRRKDLLERVEYERLCGRRWRQRPGERQASSMSTNQIQESGSLTLGITDIIRFGNSLRKCSSVFIC